MERRHRVSANISRRNCDNAVTCLRFTLSLSFSVGDNALTNASRGAPSDIAKLFLTPRATRRAPRARRTCKEH